MAIFDGISGPDMGRVIAAMCWLVMSLAALGVSLMSRDGLAIFGTGAFFFQGCLFVGGLAGRGIILEDLRWEAQASQPYMVYALDLCLLGCVFVIFFRFLFRR